MCTATQCGSPEEAESSDGNSQDSSRPGPGSQEEKTESNEEGETSSSGTGASNSEKKDENTDVSETNGEKEAEGSSSKEKEGAGNKESGKEDVETTIQKENHTLGYELPEYIGPLKERGRYMTKLLSACGQSQEYSVNEREIFFHNCTYICVKRGTNLTPEVRRIPLGMICNKDKGKCPGDGNCPLPMC
uniref:Putative ixodes 8-cys protein n=1 Tax=Ixodes ricinus TaxID=34613 RepID=A0A0K8R371_IXORI